MSNPSYNAWMLETASEKLLEVLVMFPTTSDVRKYAADAYTNARRAIEALKDPTQ